MNSPPGFLITLEGGEGAGKSTQAAFLARRLEEAGYPVLGLREPGGTPLGDYLRGWLKSAHHPLTAEAELFLFAAARAELVRTVIGPALAEGTIVVLDRFADSTTVYQGAGRGLDRRAVASANRLATQGLEPDLTFLLDVPPSLGLERANARADESGERRFEDEDPSFHRRVRQEFLRMAKRQPDRWVVLDATRPMSVVSEEIWARVRTALQAQSA